MADTLEALELKVTHNSGGAAGALKEVTSALTSLLPVVTNVNTQVHALAIGLQNIGGIKALGQAIKATTGGVKELAKSMKAVGTETKSISPSGFTTLHKTLRNVKQQIRDLDAEQRKNSGLPGGSYASIMAGSVNPATGMTGAQLQALKEKLAGTATEAVKASTNVKKVAEETINVGNAVEKLNLGDKVAATNDQIASCIRKIVELNDKIKNAENDSERNKYMDQFATMEQRYISLQGKLAKAMSTDPELGGEPGGGSEDVSKPSVFQRMSKSFERMHGMISRIMMRRVITAAIRAVSRAFKEGYTNLYKWSQALGGQFAKDMDKASAAMTQFKNSLAGAVAPALQALVPVIQTVCSWVATLMSYVSMFLAAISGMTKYYTALTGDTEKYTKAAGGAAKANKDLLASFDELNVIQSESGGGGGGGASGDSGNFRVDNLEESMRSKLARIGKIVGAATMAIGGILLFTGHPFVGLAMLSAGFATTYGSIRVDWETTPNKIESVLNTIKSLVDVAFLAVGAVLTFTNTNIPLGVALMAKGLPGVASGIVNNLDVAQEIKTILAVIEVAVSGATLATGAVMTFTGINIPLGIALMAAGFVGIGTSIAENWDIITQKMSEKLTTITAIVSGALLAIGAVIAFSNINLPLGIGMMAAGAIGLGAVIAQNWDWISEKIKSVISVIETILKAASLVVGAVLVFTGVHPLIGFGLMIYGLTGSPEAKEDPNSLIGKIQSVIETIKRILTIGSIVIGAILVFFGGPALMFKGIALLAAGIVGVATNKDFKEDIVNTINNAISSIGDFLNTWIVTPVKSVISKIVTFVANFGTSIKKTIETVVTAIGKLWDKWIGGPVGAAIDAIVDFVDGIVSDVQDVVTPVIEAIGNWWNTYIAGPISAVFDTISSIISTLKAWLGIKETKQIDVQVNTTGSRGDYYTTPPNVTLPDVAGSSSPSTAAGLTDKIAADLRGNNYLKENKLLKVSTRAEGGFIRTGQLFIAGENGIPEMIGSFGRNNAVANNEMIVTGIRQGVRDAMNEQNVLLRQQNEYLSALLNKRIYAELKPSAALGATNARSAELYAKVTGG